MRRFVPARAKGLCRAVPTVLACLCLMTAQSIPSDEIHSRTVPYVPPAEPTLRAEVRDGHGRGLVVLSAAQKSGVHNLSAAIQLQHNHISTRSPELTLYRVRSRRKVGGFRLTLHAHRPVFPYCQIAGGVPLATASTRGPHDSACTGLNLQDHRIHVVAGAGRSLGGEVRHWRPPRVPMGLASRAGPLSPGEPVCARPSDVNDRRPPRHRCGQRLGF